MPGGRPRTFEITLSEPERTALAEIAGSRSLPAGLVRRARVILLSAAGEADRDIAAAVDLSGAMVGHWRRRYRDLGLAGLYDAPRAGRPRTHGDDDVARLLRTVLRTKPTHATHWSIRSAAAKTGIHRSTVQRYFALFGVQPHRSKSFKLPPIRSSSKRSATSSASTSIRPTTRSCSPWTRRVRSRRWSARRHSCPWASAMSKA